MNKHINNNITLDKKHNEMLKTFKNNEVNLIPKYNDEIAKLNNSLNKKSNKSNVEKIKEIYDRIDELNKKIVHLNDEKKQYFLNNSKYIFDYFESKKNINKKKSKKKDDATTDTTNDTTNDTTINVVSNTNSSCKSSEITNDKIHNFFYSKNKNLNNTNSIINDANDTPLVTNKNDNVSKYFYNMDRSYLNYDNFCYEMDICTFCKKGEMIYVECEGICVCNNCSKSVKYLIENEKPSYKEPPKEVCFYAYKRINHLREILAQFQAKESTQIPEEVFESIKNQIKKERIQIKDLTNKKAKEILKNLGYNKYYEHIPFIKDKLGIKPPVMSPELEETLCNLFMDIQKPYSKYCPKERVNFLNYYYTIYKLCELLGERQFLPFFPMLKDREKRIEQDQIWKKICQELDWEFIPTL